MPWTDHAGEPGLRGRLRRASTRPRWTAGASTAGRSTSSRSSDGRPVGSQSLEAERFGQTLTVGTGSWLGRAWQGDGLGTEMRAAVLQLAFGVLGAKTARSGALLGNGQSLGVSRKLGYAEVGMSSVSPRGTPVPHHDLELAGVGFRSPVPVEIEGADQLLGLFGARRC